MKFPAIFCLNLLAPKYYLTFSHADKTIPHTHTNTQAIHCSQIYMPEIPSSLHMPTRTPFQKGFIVPSVLLTQVTLMLDAIVQHTHVKTLADQHGMVRKTHITPKKEHKKHILWRYINDPTCPVLCHPPLLQ